MSTLLLSFLGSQSREQGISPDRRAITLSARQLGHWNGRTANILLLLPNYLSRVPDEDFQANEPELAGEQQPILGRLEPR